MTCASTALPYSAITTRSSPSLHALGARCRDLVARADGGGLVADDVRHDDHALALAEDRRVLRAVHRHPVPISP